jgi:hypothetical protein
MIGQMISIPGIITSASKPQIKGTKVMVGIFTDFSLNAKLVKKGKQLILNLDLVEFPCQESVIQIVGLILT